MANKLSEAQINEIVARVVSEFKKPAAPWLPRSGMPHSTKEDA